MTREHKHSEISTAVVARKYALRVLIRCGLGVGILHLKYQLPLIEIASICMAEAAASHQMLP